MITTKLVPPHYGRPLVSRARLLRRLNEHAYRTLNLVVAPAGFGKTTVLAQWRRALLARGHRVAWLSLDASDNRESLFLSYLAASLQYAGCDAAADALTIYQERGAPDAVAEFIRSLVNDLHKQSDTVYLMIDDFHLVPNPGVQDILYQIVMRAPANFHVVVASRSEPSFPLAGLQAHDQIGVFNVTDLRFDFEETRQFFAAHPMQTALEPAEVQALHEVAEGWAAGLQIATISLNRSDDKQACIQQLEQSRDIGNYLDTDVFTGLPEYVMDFLLKTSILTRFDAALANAVIDGHDAEELIRVTETENLFILPLGDDGRWYRYHPLFQAFLRKRLQAAGPQMVKALHGRASDWYRQHDMLVEAVEHAISAERIDEAVDMVEQCAMLMVEQGKLSTLLDWVERLPAAQVADRWWLRLARAWALLMSQRIDDGERALETLVRDKPPRNAVEEFAVRTAEAGGAIYRDDSAATLRLHDYWPPSGDRYHASAACNLVTFGHLFAGRFHEAREIQMWARRWDDVEQALFSLVYSKGLVGLSHLLQGRFDYAEALLADGLRRAEAGSTPQSAPMCAAAAFLSELLYERNQIATVEALLAPRYQTMLNTASAPAIILAGANLARSLRCRGERYQATDVLKRMQIRGETLGAPRMVAVSLAEQVRLLLAQGDLHEAGAVQRDLERLADAVGGEHRPDTRGEVVLIARWHAARLCLARGEYAQAITILEALAARMEAIQRWYTALQIKVLIAVALHGRGREDEALALFGELADFGEKQGLIRSFADEAPAARGLVEALLRRADRGAAGPRPEYLRALRDAMAEPRARDRQPLSAAGAPPAETLNAREVEVLGLLANGLPNKSIARALNLSVETVKWYLKRIYEKLEVSNRNQAVARARELGMLAVPGSSA